MTVDPWSIALLCFVSFCAGWFVANRIRTERISPQEAGRTRVALMQLQRAFLNQGQVIQWWDHVYIKTHTNRITYHDKEELKLVVEDHKGNITTIGYDQLKGIVYAEEGDLEVLT